MRAMISFIGHRNRRLCYTGGMEQSDHRYYMFTDPDGVEHFRAEMDDYHAKITTRMTVPLDEVREAIRRFDQEKGGGEVFMRRVRVVGPPGNLAPMVIQVTDYDTGEAIEGVFKAIITLDVKRVHSVVLEYYETNEQGAVKTNVTKQQALTHMSINEIAEVDVTAYEVRKRKKP